MLYFTAIGLGLYFFSDWLLNQIEQRRGTRFENRTLIFFAIFLVLAIISFQLMQMLMQTPPR